MHDADDALRTSASLALLYFGLGGLATALQVGLLRELTVDLGGDETAVGLGLAAWLVGIAVGARLAARAGTRVAARAAAGALALCLAGPLLIALGRAMRWAIAVPAGELLPIGRGLVLALVTLGPPGALFGATFTALAGVAEARSRRGAGIAGLYVGEAVGALAGGALMTVVAAHQSPFGTSFAAGGLAALACVPAGRAGVVPWRRGFAAAGFLLLLAGALSGPVDDALERLRYAGIAPGVRMAEFVHTPYQEIAFGESAGVRWMFDSGQLAATFPDPGAAEQLAHVVSTFAARPERVFALRGLETGALRFLLQNPRTHVTIADPDHWAQDAIRRRLPPEDATALDDPRVRVVIDDPRRFLARAGDRFDMILLDQPDPVTLLRARLGTVEFYRTCAARLAPDGVLVVPLATAPGALTGQTAALAGSIRHALALAFPVVRATPGPDTWLLAGRDASAVTLDPAVLAERWRARGVRSATVAPELFAALFPPERVAEEERALARAADETAESRDDRPVSFVHALVRRQRIAGGWFGGLLGRVSELPGFVLAALVLLPSLLAVGRQSARRSPVVARAAAGLHVVTVTGAAAMTWSLVVLFAFQARAGALYGQLGLLTALFMLGIGLGGHAARPSASTDPISPEAEGRARAWLLFTAGFALSFALLLPAALSVLARLAAASASTGVAAHGVLLLIAGFATGQVFPSGVGALLGGGLPPTVVAGRVEAADYAGAAAGALLASTLFVPLFGIRATAWLIAALEALAFASVVFAVRRRSR